MLKERDRIPFDVAFGDASLAAIEGPSEVTTLSKAGTAASPDVDEMTIEVSVEDGAFARGSSFLVLARNQQVRREIEELDLIRQARRR